MNTYKTPGAFVEEVAKLPPSVAEVATAIPAFIGYTKENNTGYTEVTPVRITSLLEYIALFGTAAVIPITVDVTEDGSGVVTAISSTFNKPKYTMYYHMQMYFANGGGPCYIVSVGAINEAMVGDGDVIASGFTVLRYDEPTLLVFPDAVNLGDSGGLYGLYADAMSYANYQKNRFVIMDCFDDNIDGLRNSVGPSGLKYGAVYYPSLNTTLGYVYDDAQVTVKWNSPTGVLLSTLSTSNNARYHIVKQYVESLTITLNPSATIAGVYASVDRTRGVWKSPANVSLNMVKSVTKHISDEDQKGLNVDPVGGKSVNAIRSFTGKGTLVWGARTLDGNSNEWRYIAVRRFFNMVEDSVKKATESFVFEPNDANTWSRVQGMIENYLLTQWRAGALQGARPEHAFYVAVGLGKTMTALDILEGRMIVEIGMAAVRPAEFIVLRFSHMMAQS